MKQILVLFSLLLNTAFLHAQQQKPNIVVIFMDDMGYGDPAFNMGIGYTTPNLNKLGAEGMRFTNFYSAQATCTASRAGILTGCYPNRIGLFGALMPWSETALNPQEETIASMLKAEGYNTCMVGKWHLGSKAPFLPTNFGFDEYLGLPYSNDMWPVDYDGNLITDTSNHKYRYPLLPMLNGEKVVKHIETLDDQGMLTQDYTNFATRFIKEQKKDKPFFLYFAHSMVHVPINASPDFRGKSELGLFGDVMQEVDWSVGQIMKTLQDQGLDENTLVIFTSDNGPWLNYGNHAGNTAGLREGKGTSFEGGQREPCLMRWPNHIPPGTVCNQIASTIDLLPTIANISGAKLPAKKIDGVNILPLLLGESGANPRQEFAYYYNRNSLEAIRQGKWKLIFPHKSRSYKSNLPGNDGHPGPTTQIDVPFGLYNLSTDPGETMDLQEQHPKVVKQLEELANKYREDLGDDLTKKEGKGRRPAGNCTECKENVRVP